jgi:hypothetical protein
VSDPVAFRAPWPEAVVTWIVTGSRVSALDNRHFSEGPISVVDLLVLEPADDLGDRNSGLMAMEDCSADLKGQPRRQRPGGHRPSPRSASCSCWHQLPLTAWNSCPTVSEYGFA